MASPQKISQLTTAGPLTGAELVPIVQNGGTLQTTVSAVAAFAVVSLVPVVSALGTQIAQVSSAVSAVNVRVDAVSAAVSSLDVRLTQVSAVGTANTAAITSINAVTSSLDTRVSVLEAAVSAIGDVSAIAGLVSTVGILEADVSALTIRVAAVSAATSVNAAAITSVNNVVSALEIRVSAASATGVTNAAAITSINAVVSALDTRVAVVSAALSAVISVAADVSAKAFRNGDHLTNVQYIDFNTTTSYAPTPGRLTWDIESGTLDLGLTGTVNLLIGQRTVAQVYNNSGVTLPKGKAVRVTGAQGQRLTGALAQADSDADSLTIFGIMLETVSVNNSGYVATDGLVRNVNTAAYADGAVVYLSPVSAGELTPTKPEAPEHLVQMGYIVKGGSVGAGSIYVKVQNGYELGELHDVKTSASTSLADGEVLVYNVSAKVWTNSPALTIAQASISALDVRVAAVSASVSALQVQVNAVSAALTSTNNVVSALEVRVSAVSAAAGPLSAAITSVNNVVSALQVQVNAVSVSVGQRVLRAGDTMTGALTITTSADQQGLTLAGRATFNALVSISTGTYTGLQNYQDNTLQRATFRDYALVLVSRGSVSAVTTLDLTDGNFFQAIAAGSTTFVFANPPVSAVGTGGAAGGFVLELQNGGAATITWPSTVRWPGGTAPTLTSSGFDVFVFITDDGGTNWRGVQSMRDSK